MSGLGKTNIELGTAGWNVVCGCTNNCPWCWSRERLAPRLAHRCKLCGEFKPHLHPERLPHPVSTKKPNRVLVCWTGDLFCTENIIYPVDFKGMYTRKSVQELVFLAAESAPWHKYLFLTKCPQNIPKRGSMYPDNWWFGTSISGIHEEDRCKDSTWGRAVVLEENGQLAHKFLMIEPLRGTEIDMGDLWGYDWIIIGAQTGKDAVSPNIDVVKEIIKTARQHNKPIWLKDNLLQKFIDLPRIQEIPEGLKLEGKI
jgi:protein gp37